jgi:uncharacterized protein (DUF1015 family)
MAKIQTIKPWRYNPILAENLAPLTGPLSETVFRQKASALYKMPFHHYHVSSPMDVPPFENAKRRIENWKLDHVLWQDPLPGLYVYAQDFEIKGKKQQRIGFIASLKLEEYANQVVFPHELTIPQAVEYRSQLLEATQMHTLPTHGYYTEPKQSIEKFMRESLLNPIYDLLDTEGVRHRMSVIQDKKVIHTFQNTLKDNKVWIADGHHRYESSLRHRNRRRIQENAQDAEQAWQYHLMWFTNTASSDLGILPTHRILHSLQDFEEETFLEKLSINFEIKELKNSQNLEVAEEAPAWTYHLLFKSKHYQITLKKNHLEDFVGGLAPQVKALEVSVLHHFILEKALGLIGDTQFVHLDFVHDAQQCLNEVKKPKVNFAILTRAVSLKEIESICFEGHTMPIKSTYFYPKVLGGLLFSSLLDSEFERVNKF